jgi:5,5'-dehydrodivanillate O-demethylase
MPNINQVRVQVMIEGSEEDVKALWADRLFWRVPVDDQHSVSYAADWIPLTGEAARKYQERRQQVQASFELLGRSHSELGEAILKGDMQIKDIDRQTNMYQLFLAEDYSVQVGQGTVADRSNETLGRSDVGVFLLRKIWERELQALAEGRPLKKWNSPAGLADQSVIA